MLHLIDALHLNTPQVICVAVIETAPDNLIMIDCGPANVFENVVSVLRQRWLHPEYAVRTTQDGEVIQIGALDLRVVETPGHAKHHNAYWLSSERLLFAGDIAGVAIGGGPILPPCPPPDIDIEAWHSSIAKIQKIDPDRLALTHFGLFTNPKAHLKELSDRLSAWAESVKNALRAGKSEEVIVPEFQQFTEQELLRSGIGEKGVAVYEQADPAAMSVTGLSRYWKKHHPEALAVSI